MNMGKKTIMAKMFLGEKLFIYHGFILVDKSYEKKLGEKLQSVKKMFQGSVMRFSHHENVDCNYVTVTL